MLKTSTLIAIIGLVVNLVFWPCVNNNLITIEPEKIAYIYALINLTFTGSLVQFFVVFYIKLSATKK